MAKPLLSVGSVEDASPLPWTVPSVSLAIHPHVTHCRGWVCSPLAAERVLQNKT
jgi:hypothetical protein